MMNCNDDLGIYSCWAVPRVELLYQELSSSIYINRITEWNSTNTTKLIKALLINRFV